MDKVMIILFIFLSNMTMSQQTQLTEKETREIKQKVREMAFMTRTIESDFVQEKEMNVLAEKITSRGKFLFKKDKMLRWEYLTPFPYLIIINKDRMMVKDEDKENHINLQSSKVFREVNNIIMGAIQGTLLDDVKNFSSTLLESKNHYICKLIPLNPKLKESLGEIWLYFNKSDFMVEKLEMRDASGDYTRITFSSKKINQTIPDEKFAL